MAADWSGFAYYGGENKYRYVLGRRFFSVPGRKICTFIMLNPSTATAEISDPTVRRCEGYARRWGYSRLHVVNIFALRSTDPKNLYTDPDPIGPDNDNYIVRYCWESSLVVCAWGTHGKHLDRGRKVLKMISGFRPHYLRLTRDGIPSHPLYLPGDILPKPFPV